MAHFIDDRTELPHGLWRSPLAPDELLAQPSPPMYPFRHRGRLYWLEALAEEGGRIALMTQPRPAVRHCLTPAEFNLRTTVHEYGGRCFCLLGEQIIFNNFSDGRIYRQRLGEDTQPVAVTAPPEDGTSAFADLVQIAEFGAVVAVMEYRESDGGEGDSVVVIEVSGEAGQRGMARPVVLVEGSDFYACPVISPNQRELAWLEWDQPYMPWDRSRLAKAELCRSEAGIGIRRRRVLVDGAEQSRSRSRSICQLGFLADGSLLFVSDGGGSDFWDFFRYQDHGSGSGNGIQRITNDSYEYGEPHWVFGQRRWQGISENRIIAVASDHDGDRLMDIALDSGRTTPLSDEVAACAHLCADSGARELLLVAHCARRGAEIRSLAWQGGGEQTLYAPPSNPAAQDGARPRPIAYPTRDGQRAFAYFHVPCNRRYRAPPGSKPPLLVIVHGGPTGRATPQCSPLTRFFTSLGYAVLDVNHRGSSGYGRAYRQSLLGQWGEIDTTDIADGVGHLVARNLVDAELIFIRGGSAGGYAVLRALTRFPDLFSGGACYYGIGNLITLAQITHRFEGNYTDRLIGEKFDADTARRSDSRFTQRSPIFQLERLNSPLILFQGLEDKVVPPEVSREVVECLAKRGILHEYIEYPNEGHGFRRLHNRVDSLERETAFFSQIIRQKRGVLRP